MARKLSRTDRYCVRVLLAAAVSLAGARVIAEVDVRVAAPSNVVDNPFVAAAPKPLAVAAEPQAAPRGPTTYENPFLKTSKSPPVDTSLRPGPVSRWKRALLPREEPSIIRSAVTARPAPPTLPTSPTWDQLPPAENLRQRAWQQSAANDPTFYDRLIGSNPGIHFSPTPLTQPSSLTPAESAPIPAPGPAKFEEPLGAISIAERPAQSPIVESSPKDPGRVSAAFALDLPAIAPNPIAKDIPVPVPNLVLNPAAGSVVAASTPSVEIDPAIITDSDDKPDDWLSQAQQAATNADSVAELTTVIGLCDRGIRSKPSEKMLSSLQKLAAWAHNQRGELHSDAQQPDVAFRDFQAAITLDPNCSMAIHNRAVSLAQRNKFGAALRDFNRVIELNPGLALAYRNRAELLAAMDRMEDAISDYSRAIDSLPNDATLLCARAHAYQRLGDFKHATTDLTRAIQLAPQDPDAYTQRGSLAAEQGEFGKAQEDFRRAIAIDANWAGAYRSLAWLQATCPNPSFRDPQQALANAQQASELGSPDDYLTLDTLAAARAAAGQFDLAAQIEEKAVGAAPQDANAMLVQRLNLYRNGHAYSSTAGRSNVRTVSHESPVPSPPPRRSPTTRKQ